MNIRGGTVLAVVVKMTREQIQAILNMFVKITTEQGNAKATEAVNIFKGVLQEEGYDQ